MVLVLSCSILRRTNSAAELCSQTRPSAMLLEELGLTPLQFFGGDEHLNFKIPNLEQDSC